MTRTLIRRIEKLEQSRPQRLGRWHRIIGETEADLEAKAAVLRASPEWREGDGIIQRLIVDPEHREAA